MAVIYYHFFKFYKNILKDDTPHMLTIMALSASEGFITSFALEVILANKYCYNMNNWQMMSFVVFFLIVNYSYFVKSGKHLKVVEEKPLFFNSRAVSIVITLLFFIATVSSVFWGPVYTKEILDSCK